MYIEKSTLKTILSFVGIMIVLLVLRHINDNNRRDLTPSGPVMSGDHTTTEFAKKSIAYFSQDWSEQKINYYLTKERYNVAWAQGDMDDSVLKLRDSTGNPEDVTTTFLAAKNNLGLIKSFDDKSSCLKDSRDPSNSGYSCLIKAQFEKDNATISMIMFKNPTPQNDDDKYRIMSFVICSEKLCK